MTIQEGYNGSVQTLELDFSHKPTPNRQSQADTRILNPQTILYSVNDDKDVRILIHNMMELYEGTTIMNIVAECQKEFHQRYFGMKLNDWRHLLGDYVRKVTERPNLLEEEVFRYVMAI